MFGYHLSQSLEGDSRRLLVGYSISELRVEILVQLHDARQQLHAPPQARVLQYEPRERVKVARGVGQAGVGEDTHGEGVLGGEPRVADIHGPTGETITHME